MNHGGPIDSEIDLAASILENADRSLILSSLDQAIDLAADYRAAGFYFALIARDSEALVAVYVNNAWRYAEKGFAFGKTSSYQSKERFSSVPALPLPPRAIDAELAATRMDEATKHAAHAADLSMQAARAMTDVSALFVSAPAPAQTTTTKIPTLLWVLTGLTLVVAVIATVHVMTASDAPPAPIKKKRRLRPRRRRKSGRAR